MIRKSEAFSPPSAWMSAIANGPQQVNNGIPAIASARENRPAPKKLLEQSNDKRMEPGTQGAAISG
jgi:hypothetical protein